MSQKLINTTYQYIADYLLHAKNNAVQLLQVNGVNINNDATQAAVQTAFLTALANSDSFRAQAAVAIARYENSKQMNFGGQQPPVGKLKGTYQSSFETKSYGFGGQQTPAGHFQSDFDPRATLRFTGPGATDFLNSIDDTEGDDYYGSDAFTTPDITDDTPIAVAMNPNAISVENPTGNDAPVNYTVQPNAGNPSLSPTQLNPKAVSGVVASGSSSTGGLTSLLTSGLNLVSTKLSTDAQKAQAQSAVALAQEQLAAKLAPTTGTSVTTILIVVGVIGLLGGVAYAVFHKKKG